MSFFDPELINVEDMLPLHTISNFCDSFFYIFLEDPKEVKKNHLTTKHSLIEVKNASKIIYKQIKIKYLEN